MFANLQRVVYFQTNLDLENRNFTLRSCNCDTLIKVCKGAIVVINLGAL
jgi:hypothetical protein